MWVAPSAVTCSFSACTRRDLPMPGSPLSSTTWPAPALACSQRSLQQAQLRARDHQWSQARLTADLKAALRLTLACTTWYTAQGAESPLSGWGPRSWQSNKPATRRCVAALITTVSGSASPCIRAAMLGVSPKRQDLTLFAAADFTDDDQTRCECRCAPGRAW